MRHGLIHISRILSAHFTPHSREYTDYMQSAEWQLKRAKVIQRAQGYCERCGKRAIREVHHLTYARLGDEDMGDLIGLCAACHVRADAERRGR